MKKKIALGAIAAFTAIAAFGTVSAQAASADSSGWYGGLQVSRSGLELNGGQIDGAMARQGIATSTGIGSHDTGWGADIGYSFNRNLAVEGGYTNLGDYKYNSAATAPGVDSINGTYKAHALSLAAVGTVPLTDQWSLFGKAGITRVAADMTAGSTTGATAPGNQSASTTGLVLGGGATYDFTKTLFGKLELDRFTHVGNAATGSGNVDVWSMGVGMRF